MTCKILITMATNSLLQVKPSPVYPISQEQACEPSVSAQVALTWQSSIPFAHSSMSENNNVLDYWNGFGDN